MSGIDEAAVDSLIEWMIDGARPSASANEIIEIICRRLTEAGIPIERFALFLYTLHPQLVGYRFTWTPVEGVRRAEGKMGLFSTDEYTVNPLPTVVEKHVAIRRKLADPDCPHDYIIVDELIADGFTDYFVQPIIYTTGEANAASWSSKAQGGFSDQAISVLERINRPLARLVEAYLLRLNAATLLSAYVGRNGGEQVLRGKIHRGDGEEVEAAILFTDIAGYTALSNTLAGPQVVGMLNDTFDLMVPEVTSRGGEILKFMGDGFLAIYPNNDDTSLAAAVKAAHATVLQMEAMVADAPVGRHIRFRSAIHAGRFHYGNIGGANRLDFTAIGRPVNFAARLLGAASNLRLSRVASALVAPHLGPTAKLAATLELKGFDEPQEIYTF